MNKKRPKNLNLLTIRFPVPAIASILHRISGIILCLFIPIVLWALNLSLRSQEGFHTVHDFFRSPLPKVIIWGLLSAFIYHFLAGIRHLLMDLHIGAKLSSGRLGAQLTILVAFSLIILLGVWLW